MSSSSLATHCQSPTSLDLVLTRILTVLCLSVAEVKGRGVARGQGGDFTLTEQFGDYVVFADVADESAFAGFDFNGHGDHL